MRPARALLVAALVAALASLGLTGCAAPSVRITTHVSGLDIPWDVAFLPDGTLVYDERPGRIGAVVGGTKRVLAEPADVLAAGETGLMGLAVDPAFATNRFLYVCMASTRGPDVRLVRWKVNATLTGLTDRVDIVTGLPIKTVGEEGRHSGCRPRFGPDGYLYVGTGDAATGTVPQDDASLGGKILRLTRDGAAAPGNPQGRRWISKGHRNVQGLAFRPDGLAVSVEHGPLVDDEVNRLVPGNFGWDPRAPGSDDYFEGVPMTDLARYPNAIRPLWRSGSSTIATSGATFLRGDEWGTWNRALVVAALVGQQLLVLQLDGNGAVKYRWNALDDQYGRLRTPVQGPDGALYVTTSNGGGNDRILRITPG